MNIAQKLNSNKSLNDFARNKALDAIQQEGKSLPAIVVKKNGNMVEVAFALNSQFTLSNVTIPIFGPEYIRYPMQAGDKGLVIPMSTYIGGMSGQGGGTASLTTPLNLSALVYLPISNTQWASVDPNVLVMYGPEGVTLRDSESQTTFMLKPDAIIINTVNELSVTVGGTEFVLTPTSWSLSGINGSLTDGGGTTSPAVMGAAWSALLAWANSHVHTNGNGGANTGSSTTTLSAEIVNP